MLQKHLAKIKRRARIRAKISGTASTPRVAIFRGNVHISAQAIDDTTGKTLCSASDNSISSGTKTQRASEVGAKLAKELQSLNITSIVFDRGGNAYHGRVSALASALRENGISF